MGSCAASEVAPKAANVVLNNAFSKSEGVVVDTHVKRVATRLGLTAAKTPEAIERDLMEVLPEAMARYLTAAHPPRQGPVQRTATGLRGVRNLRGQVSQRIHVFVTGPV